MKNRILSLIIILILLLGQVSALAYTDIGDVNNLPPLASMDLSKKRAIDINIANDGTTGYSTSTLNSKINEILKPKLAQEGVDFKVNVMDSVDKNIYQEISRAWTTAADSGEVLISWNGANIPYSCNIYIDQNTGNTKAEWWDYDHYAYTDHSQHPLCYLPNLDCVNYIYRLSIYYTTGNVKKTLTKEIYSQNDLVTTISPLTLNSTLRLKLEVAAKLPREVIKGGTFDTGNNYYTRNKISPYAGWQTSAPGGVSGSVYYRITPDNKVIIKKTSLNYSSFVNDKRININFYSDYASTSLIRTTELIKSREYEQVYSEVTSEDIVIDFSDIKDSVKSIDFRLVGYYFLRIGLNSWIVSGSLCPEGDISKGTLDNYYLFSENVKRKAFVSENLSNTTWREGAEKFYIDLSNRDYSENTYGEGKAKSLQTLLSKDVIMVKMGCSSTEAGSDNFVKDNNDNGRFIDNANIDKAVEDLTNYILNRVKINLDLASCYDNSTDKGTLASMKSLLSAKLKKENMDITVSNYRLVKESPGVYPINRFYFLALDVISGYGNPKIWYYDEIDKKFINTGVSIERNNGCNFYMYPSGKIALAYTAIIYHPESNFYTNENKVITYVPVSGGIKQVGNAISTAFSLYESVPQYVYDPNFGINSRCYGLKAKSFAILGDGYLYIKYATDEYFPIPYKVLKFNPATGGVVGSYLVNDPAVNSIVWQTCTDSTYYSEYSNGTWMQFMNLGTTKLGTYRLTGAGNLYTPDGNIVSVLANIAGWGITPMPTSYPATELSPYVPTTITEKIQIMPNESTSLPNKNYVAYISNDYLSDTIDTNNQATVVNKLKSNNASFVGISGSNNITRINSLITANNNKGKYIDNTNMTTATIQLADYIISTAKRTSDKVENGSYVVVSENETPIEFEAGGLNNTTGVQVIDPSAIRAKEYITADSNGNYTISENGTGISSVKVFCYDTNLVLVGSPISVNTNNRFTVPLNTSYIKISSQTTDTAKASALTIIDNSLDGGEALDYKPNVTDIENDTADIMFKFDHDNKNIAGVAITNPSDKLALSGVELSAPIERFTKPGTYKISMFAKDIPKQIPDTTNLLPNGDAETVNASGILSDWSTWAAAPTTTFTRRTTTDWKIAGNGSFEIVTSSVNDGSNNSACYYKDIPVSPNTSYTLSGLLGSHRCLAYFVTYEMDDSYNVIRSLGSNIINNNATPQTSSLAFTTGFNTTKLRVHILKGATTNYITGNSDYVFADNITLVKMLPNPLFNGYRKTSTPATATIYAHRLPRAEFTYQIENSAGSFKVKNLADNQLSYDPDHTDKSNKGIINSQWRWAEIKADGTTTWHDGKLNDTTAFATGTQVLMWYRVQDSDGPNGIGAWSMPKVVGTDGSLADPVALFVATPNPLPMQNEIELTDQSYSTNFGGTITSRTWTIQKMGAAVKPLIFDSSDIANGKYYKQFTSTGFGKYTIYLSVTDSFGKVSKPYSQVINVIDTINPTVSVSPTSGTFTGDSGVTVNMTCTDNTSSTSYNRGLKTIEYAWSKSTIAPQVFDTVQTINIPTEGIYTKSLTTTQIQEGTWYLYIKDIDYAGNSNNNDTYVRFGPYTVITNRPPVVTILGVSPSYLYEGDDVTANFIATDPDLDTLTCIVSIKQGTNTLWSGSKIVTPTGSTYPTISMPTKQDIAVGSYVLEVVATDPEGLTDTKSYSFSVYELGIKGQVSHTTLWEQHRQDYNKAKSGNVNNPRMLTDFFTGEKFMLFANTTDIHSGSSVTVINVKCDIIGTSFSDPSLSPTSINYKWTGSIWDETMLKWASQPVNFKFTVTYSNGTTKIDTVNINILDDEYWRLHRLF
jgi:hypothetical protein